MSRSHALQPWCRVVPRARQTAYRSIRAAWERWIPWPASLGELHHAHRGSVHRIGNFVEVCAHEHDPPPVRTINVLGFCRVGYGVRREAFALVGHFDLNLVGRHLEPNMNVLVGIALVAMTKGVGHGL